ncbi:mitochondrial sodium/calcium exchanger protein-like [Musca vetustissima]|uniref:mitochondrial sodium/calcium exchanger protein-like n=1 Tax=Musca vetustissima TaxID=27455 RepID=UPI002AB739E8|nr:mitochondrial sodium/calcium exchanger protein-like [Musca vetustissima]
MLIENFNSSNTTFPYFLPHDNFVQDVHTLTCALVNTLPYDKRCDYVRATAQCSEDVFIFNYIELFYCRIDTSQMVLVVGGIVALLLCCALLFLILGSTADGFFCPSLKVLSTMLGLNENVAGVTLLAFGNCAPDMMTSLTGLSGESRRLYSDIMAGGLFVVFCVAGCIVAFVPFVTQPSNFLRDCLFLLLAVVFIDYSMITDKAITVWEGVGILGIYLCYIVVVCLDQYLVVQKVKAMKADSRSLSSISSEYFSRLSREAHFEIHSRSCSQQMERNSIPFNTEHHANYLLFQQFWNAINPIDRDEWLEGGRWDHTIMLLKAPIEFALKLLIPIVDFELDDHGWSKLLNCLQLIGLPVCISWALVGGEFFLFGIPLWVGSAILTVPLAMLAFCRSRTDITPEFHKYFALLSALGSIYVIYACAAETISILNVLGLTTQRSNSFLGCTLLAWGNSIGDLVANVALARQGYQKMGFAACFGGPMFNILIGIGLGMTYKAGVSAELRTNKKTIAEGTMGVNITVFLIIGLILLIFGASSTNFILRRSLGIFMILIYLIFLIFTFLGEMEIIHTYGSDHRMDMKLEELD